MTQSKGEKRAKEIIDVIGQEMLFLKPKERWEYYRTLNHHINTTIATKLGFKPVLNEQGEYLDWDFKDDDEGVNDNGR